MTVAKRDILYINSAFNQTKHFPTWKFQGLFIFYSIVQCKNSGQMTQMTHVYQHQSVCQSVTEKRNESRYACLIISLLKHVCSISRAACVDESGNPDQTVRCHGGDPGGCRRKSHKNGEGNRPKRKESFVIPTPKMAG